MDSSRQVAAVTVGSLLRGEREARGWTLGDLAARSGIAAPNLSRLERGLADVRLSTLRRAANALGVDITLSPAGRPRQLAEVVREAARARERIIAAGLGESEPWARLARRELLGEQVAVEAAALRGAQDHDSD